jgi:tRNA(Arg) A34 adenosine deaminase TadA
MRDWKQTVNEYKARDTFDDDVAAHRACQLAATASTLGTYAVGAVLLDDNGRVLSEGHNETFINGFRSDLHAEMVVLNKFETEHQNSIKPSTLTLVSSLEPCPMCTARLIYAGIVTFAPTHMPGWCHASPRYRPN